MTTNLRADDRFVQDAGWYAAADRYDAYLKEHAGGKLLLLELGVGGNTPVIIKYPFWRLTAQNPDVTYACLNLGEADVPEQIAGQSICVDADIAEEMEALAA